jgi:hypothetical protein
VIRKGLVHREQNIFRRRIGNIRIRRRREFRNYCLTGRWPPVFFGDITVM